MPKARVEKHQGWHPEDIRAALRKKFGTLQAFAVEIGWAPNGNLSRVISKAGISIPVERRISEAIDVPLHELWPDRWLPDGRPIGRSERARHSSSDAFPQRQIGEAA